MHRSPLDVSGRQVVVPIGGDEREEYYARPDSAATASGCVVVKCLVVPGLVGPRVWATDAIAGDRVVHVERVVLPALDMCS